MKKQLNIKKDIFCLKSTMGIFHIWEVPHMINFDPTFKQFAAVCNRQKCLANITLYSMRLCDNFFSSGRFYVIGDS